MLLCISNTSYYAIYFCDRSAILMLLEKVGERFLGSVLRQLPEQMLKSPLQILRIQMNCCGLVSALISQCFK